MVVKYLLKFALEKDQVHLHVFGDYLLVVKWMKNILQIQDITLLPLVEKLKEISKHFNLINYTHVLRELNTIVDALSKA